MKLRFARCTLLSLGMFTSGCDTPIQQEVIHAEVHSPSPTIEFSRAWVYRHTQRGRSQQTFIVVRDLDGQPAIAR